MLLLAIFGNSRGTASKAEGGPPAAEPEANFRELMRSNQFVLQQMNRQFTRHVQRSGKAYPGRLVNPLIRSDQTQSEMHPGRTRREGPLLDSAAASLENMRLQHSLQQCDWDGRF